MSIKGIVRSAAIGACIYGVVKTVEFVGVCKGILWGSRAALNDPEKAKEAVDSWDELEQKWGELKAQFKKA